MIPPLICSMCIKTNEVGKQEVGMWRVQKRFPQYGVPIWSLWLNIRFVPSRVVEKNATKNISGWTEGQTDGRTDRGKRVLYLPPVERGYDNCLLLPLHDGCLAEKQQIPILVFTHESYDLQLFRKMKRKIWIQKEAIHCVYWKANLP